MGGVGYDKTLFNKALALKRRAALWNGVGSVVGNLGVGLAQGQDLRNRIAATQQLAQQSGLQIDPATARYLDPKDLLQASLRKQQSDYEFGKQKELETFRTGENIRQDKESGVYDWRQSQINENKRQAEEAQNKADLEAAFNESLRQRGVPVAAYHGLDAEGRTAMAREKGLIGPDPIQETRLQTERLKLESQQRQAEAERRAQEWLQGNVEDPSLFLSGVIPGEAKTRMLEDSGAISRRPSGGSPFDPSIYSDEQIAATGFSRQQLAAMSNDDGTRAMATAMKPPRANTPNFYAKKIGIAQFVIDRSQEELDGPLMKQPDGSVVRAKEQGIRHQLQELGDNHPQAEVLKNKIKMLEDRIRQRQADVDRFVSAAMATGTDEVDDDPFTSLIQKHLEQMASEMDNPDDPAFAED